MPLCPRQLSIQFCSLALALLAFTGTASAAAPQPGPPLSIRRTNGPITIDGDLSDPGWQGADSIVTWFETNATDNTVPQVRNIGWLAYDDRYLYAAFRFDDPHPNLIRAPLGDHDNISGATDYGGVIVSSRNDGKTAYLFLANPNGLQYDAVSSDITGEDSSPDFYWDAVGKITPSGWTMEIRIPFSSLRYSNEENPTWSIMLYRNYPRDRHYQFFTARLPKDVNCFICNSSKLAGLSGLPHGSHLVVAPFTTSQRSDAPIGNLGTPLRAGDLKANSGVDVKWNPFADVAIDGTLRPDFSQVESDAAQIGANERFALFYPEKRTFFIEGVDLFATPFQAVYTRTITSPDEGLRATGRVGTTSFTALGTRDRGGGQVILPGPFGSDQAPQDFRSDVGIIRMRHDMGQSFVSVLATDREIDGGGHNRVFGPDFQWRPRPTDSFTGQALWSQSLTPVHPDLAAEWDGRSLNDRALLLNWSHSTRHEDWFLQGQDIGPQFRADDGFMPQVGYRQIYFEPGYTIRPKDEFFSRVRFFSVNWADLLPSGSVLDGRASVGAGMDGRWNSFTRVELNRDVFSVGGHLLRRYRPRIEFQTVPGRLVNNITIDTYFGQEVDFVNARQGRGATVATSVTIRPSEHLELRNDASGRWLYVDAAADHNGRLFHAEVERMRATYSFNSRTFVRLIGQYQTTRRDTSLYTTPSDVTARDADFSSSFLFAYKLNWQTVLYAGYGDDRTFTDVTGRLEKSGREAFAKVSYAWQR